MSMRMLARSLVLVIVTGLVTVAVGTAARSRTVTHETYACNSRTMFVDYRDQYVWFRDPTSYRRPARIIAGVMHYGGPRDEPKLATYQVIGCRKVAAVRPRLLALARKVQGDAKLRCRLVAPVEVRVRHVKESLRKPLSVTVNLLTGRPSKAFLSAYVGPGGSRLSYSTRFCRLR